MACTICKQEGHNKRSCKIHNKSTSSSNKIIKKRPIVLSESKEESDLKNEIIITNNVEELQNNLSNLSLVDINDDSKWNININIPDCFVSPYLKLSNGKDGHGERRLYTGDNYLNNEKLATKPWFIIYSDNYFNDIKPLLSNDDNFAKYCTKREEMVLSSIELLQNKPISVMCQNGEKDVRRYYVGPQKSDKKNIKLWDTFRNTIIPKKYYLNVVEYSDHFKCNILCIETNLPNSFKKSASVSNIQKEYFKYKEKEYSIEIQGGHNGTEFQLRNPVNGYYWPVDGRHVCGIHKCSGNKDSPCPYNMYIWEFQGDYFHGNPKKYNKDDNFHNIKLETKWEKDKKKKEFYESLGYIVKIVWESEWVNEKKSLKSQGKTWRIESI